MKYYLRAIVGVSVGGIPAAFLCYWWRGGDWWLAGWLLGGSLSGIPIDKFIDERYRSLEKFATDDAS